MIGTVTSKKRPAEILLVEDNVADVLLTKKVFKNTPLPSNITVASNGEEAMSILRREGIAGDNPPPDIVLLDLNLPKKSGVEVLREMKTDKNLWHIPVIVLTTSRADKDISDCRALYVNAYVVKPLDFSKFQGFADALATFWFSYALAPCE